MSNLKGSLAERTERVADAPSNNWVYRSLPRGVWPYAQLARWDRPIGWQLLLWPCWWSAALAPQAIARRRRPYRAAEPVQLALFLIGAIAMRGAGCTYNDLVDQKIDDMVARTRSRPLPSGRVSAGCQAKLFLVVQSLRRLLVLLQFNPFAILLGIGSLAVGGDLPVPEAHHLLAAARPRPRLLLGRADGLGRLLGLAQPARLCCSMRHRSCGRSATTRSTPIRTRRTTRSSACARRHGCSAATRARR